MRQFFASRLQQCSAARDLTGGRRVHAEVSSAGLDRDAFLAGILVQLYGRCGWIEAARAAFDRAWGRTAFLCSSLISAYGDNGCLLEARDVFDRMPQQSVVSATAILKACSRAGNLWETRTFFDRMAQRNIVSWTVLIAALAQGGHLAIARRVFHLMPVWDVISSTAMVAALAQSGEIHQARILFEAMPERNVVSWNAMISGLSDHSLLREAKTLFDGMDHRDEASWNSMISGNAVSGYFETAQKLMRKMPRWSMISLNTMIVASGGIEGFFSAKMIFDSISQKDPSHWTAILSAFGHQRHISETLDFFDKLPQWSIVTWTITTAALAKNGRIKDAKLLFDRAPWDQRDTAAWNAMISSLLDNDLHDEAFGMVQAMDLDGVRPNKVTLIAALEASSGCSSLARAKTIHSLLRESDLLADSAVRTALTNAFGRLGDALGALSSLTDDHPADAHAWNSILSAHSQSGGFQEAVDAFLAMNLEGITPDAITFMTTLALCGHTGVPGEGWRHFVSMEVDHGVEPRPGHYACMVDVLARAGRLAEAEELVMTMPFEPDELALRAILAACKLHDDCEQGLRAVEMIVELDSSDRMPYITLLSSLYAQK